MDFETLEEEWNGILTKNLMGNNVFLTWEWLSTWWKHFGRGRELLILLVEDKNRILAIAPLMWSKYKLPGFGNVKKIEFIGAPHSDYHNFIVLERRANYLKTVIEFLKGFIDWDWVELKEVPEATPTADAFQEVLSYFSSEFQLKKETCTMCPYINLPSSFDFLETKLDNKLRKNLRYYLKKIRKRHNVKLEKYNYAGFSVEEAMKIFINLHQSRCSMKGLAGVFCNDDFRHFHMDVAELFSRKGWLGLYFLTADGNPISAQYTFEYSRKMYFYLGGFDPEYSDYSIGNIMTMFVLDKCIENQFEEYDLMRGGEQYKFRWTNDYRKNLEIRLIRKNLISRLYEWATSSRTIDKLATKLKLSLTPGYVD